jgi:hypothetical protein
LGFEGLCPGTVLLDCFRIAQGLLCYVHAPPGTDAREFNAATKFVNKKLSKNKLDQVNNINNAEVAAVPTINGGTGTKVSGFVLTICAGAGKSKKQKKTHRKHLDVIQKHKIR